MNQGDLCQSPGLCRKITPVVVPGQVAQMPLIWLPGKASGWVGVGVPRGQIARRGEAVGGGQLHCRTAQGS